MVGLSIRGYARHRGVSHTAVRKALATGRISAAPDGTIDPLKADRDWAGSTDPSKPLNSVTGVPKMRRVADAPSAPHLSTSSDATAGAGADEGATRLASSYAASRAARESYQARLAKLEFEERSGKLVDSDEVRAHIFSLVRRLRDSLLGIPDRLAPVLVGETDQALIHRRLTEELTTSLAELSKAPPLSFGPKSDAPT